MYKVWVIKWFPVVSVLNLGFFRTLGCGTWCPHREGPGAGWVLPMGRQAEASVGRSQALPIWTVSPTGVGGFFGR